MRYFVIIGLTIGIGAFFDQYYTNFSSDYVAYARYVRKSLAAERRYVRIYGKKKSKKYPRNFPEDCTNYASQLAVAGKYKRTSKAFFNGGLNGRSESLKKWYAYLNKYSWKGRSYSSTWTSVDMFWKYFTKTKKRKHYTFKTQKSIRRHARPGDVVQFWDQRAKWFHTVTIISKNRKDVYYTSHQAYFKRKGLKKANHGRGHGESKIRKYRIIKMGIR